MPLAARQRRPVRHRPAGRVPFPALPADDPWRASTADCGPSPDSDLETTAATAAVWRDNAMTDSATLPLPGSLLVFPGYTHALADWLANLAEGGR